MSYRSLNQWKPAPQRSLSDFFCTNSSIGPVERLRYQLLPSSTPMNLELSASSLASRRRFLARLGGAAVFFTIPGAFAEQLIQTPAQTEGPFYPDHLPLDTDNDLLVINSATTPALGEVTYLSGRVLSPTGAPIRNAAVEIW